MDVRPDELFEQESIEPGFSNRFSMMETMEKPTVYEIEPNHSARRDRPVVNQLTLSRDRIFE